MKWTLAFLLLFNANASFAHRPQPVPCAGLFAVPVARSNDVSWVFNSSNSRKRQLLTQAGLTSHIQWLEHDLEEIDSSHEDIVTHKASYFKDPDQRVIVEDTAFYVEGTDIGTDIKWRVHELEEHVGKKAIWVSMLAYRVGDMVLLFRHALEGYVTNKQSDVEGIEAYFSVDPESPAQEFVAPSVVALSKLLSHKVHQVRAPIETWDGPWQ